ncbi:MAG: FHA domain-containing protein [Deltaproteobacteria bacterium]|nr:FHA domain-containing protein [Deltaproteobacteria bacterium]
MIRLCQTKGADAGRELEFKQDLIRIGRMPDSDVNFDPEVDLDASGRHAEIRNEDGRYLLIDTGSRNGTWLNGQRIKHAALGDGDEIEFGRGGPKILIASVRNRPSSREPTGRITSGVTRRDPKFDPLAMPVTTATRLEDLVSRSGALGSLKSPPASEARASSRRPRPSRNSTLLWGAAGVLLVAAIALIVTTALQ